MPEKATNPTQNTIRKIKPVFAFFDAENIRNALEESGYSDLDYKKIFDWLKYKRNVGKAFIYAGIEVGDHIKEEYYKELEQLGYSVSAKYVTSYKRKATDLHTKCPKCKFTFDRKYYHKDKKKANCDAELTLDVVRFGVRKKYSSIMVFSGDGDFASVYEYVAKELKKRVVVYAPSNNRTSLKVKDLAKSGIITLEGLDPLLLHYAKK